MQGREQFSVTIFAEALESIATVLAENAGLDPIEMLTDLRSKHAKGEIYTGINVLEGKIQDMRQNEVYEPLTVKRQIIKSANEAATMILKIDDVIATAKMKAPPMPPGGGMPGGGMGGYPGGEF